MNIVRAASPAFTNHFCWLSQREAGTLAQIDRRKWPEVCECYCELATAKVAFRSHSIFYFMPAAKRQTDICSYKCYVVKYKFYSYLLRSCK